MRQTFTFILLATLIATVTQVYADSGEAKVDNCLGCHGIPSYGNVYPSYKVPKLAGQHRDYLVQALKDYRSGNRSHPTMKVQAGTLSDQDMMDIATYFSAKESAPGNPNAEVPESIAAKVATCAACHTNDGNSVIAAFPKIAGQREDYLYHALRSYKSGERKNPIMLGIVNALSDDDMLALARYFSLQDGLGTIALPNFSDK